MTGQSGLGVLAALLILFPRGGLAVSTEERLDLYFHDTVASLRSLRFPRGLISDRRGMIIENEAATSPTNIAFDLLAELEALRFADLKPGALASVEETLSLLAAVPRAANGLFFSRYTPVAPFQVVDATLSSIDNLHLALALWTLSETFPDASWRATSRELFQQMSFKGFYDPKSGLFHGILRLVNGVWVPDSWSFGYFGSESRSLYSLAFALGLVDDPNYLERAFSSFAQDLFLWSPQASEPRPLFDTWSGGAFQELLPELLVAESRYSPFLSRLFQNYSRFVLAEGARRGLPLPASHSACQIHEELAGVCPADGCYNGNAGSLALVARSNADARDPWQRSRWESVVTPYAVFLAAGADPKEFAPSFLEMERLGLYQPGLGFWDGLWVSGRSAGQVVRELLSLDQGMLALSLARMLSADHLIESARALSSNPVTRQRLQEFYSRVDRYLEDIPEKSEIMR